MVDAELQRRVADELRDWRLDGEVLVATYRFADFSEAFAAATRVAFLAERAHHHPDLTVGWGRLDIRIMSHDVGRLTQRDLLLAHETTKALGTPSALTSD